MKQIGIYKITNILNDRVYIGQSVDIDKRWKKHLAPSTFKTNNSELYKDMIKFGITNFKFKILTICPISKLNEKEIHYIKKYNSFYKGYNSTKGGSGNQVWDEISKKRVSDGIRNKYGYGDNSTHHSKEVFGVKILCVEEDMLFKTVSDAYRWLEKTQNGNIALSIKNNRKAYGYTWKYV